MRWRKQEAALTTVALVTAMFQISLGLSALAGDVTDSEPLPPSEPVAARSGAPRTPTTSLSQRFGWGWGRWAAPAKQAPAPKPVSKPVSAPAAPKPAPAPVAAPAPPAPPAGSVQARIAAAWPEDATDRKAVCLAGKETGGTYDPRITSARDRRSLSGTYWGLFQADSEFRASYGWTGWGVEEQTAMAYRGYKARGWGPWPPARRC